MADPELTAYTVPLLVASFAIVTMVLSDDDHSTKARFCDALFPRNKEVTAEPQGASTHRSPRITVSLFCSPP